MLQGLHKQPYELTSIYWPMPLIVVQLNSNYYCSEQPIKSGMCLLKVFLVLI